MTWTSNEFANSFTLLLDHGRHSRHVHIETILSGTPISSCGATMESNTPGGEAAYRDSQHGARYGLQWHGAPRCEQHYELNHVYDTHWSWDTGGVTINWASSDVVIRRNWIHDLGARNGIRFDGHPGIKKGASQCGFSHRPWLSPQGRPAPDPQ